MTAPRTARNMSRTSARERAWLAFFTGFWAGIAFAALLFVVAL